MRPVVADREHRAAIVALQRGLIEAVEKLLSEIQPRLRRRPGAARASTMLHFGAINWTHTWFDAKGAISAAALADMATDLTLNGLSE